MTIETDIERVLGHYGIDGKVVGEKRGPLLRLMEFEPAAGTKIKKLAAILDDAARELKVFSMDIEPVSGSVPYGWKFRWKRRKSSILRQ